MPNKWRAHDDDWVNEHGVREPIVEYAPRVVLYDADGSPMARPIGFSPSMETMRPDRKAGRAKRNRK